MKMPVEFGGIAVVVISVWSGCNSTICWTIAFLSIATSPVFATQVVDQEQLRSEGSIAIPAETWQYQVRAGLTGKLTSITVLSFGGGTITEFFVNVGPAWQTDEHDFSINLNFVGETRTIDVSSANIQLEDGDPFVFGFTPQIPRFFGLRGTSMDVYPDGELWGDDFPPGTPGAPIAAGGEGFDLYFFTVMEPIPEPSTFVQCALALVALAVRRCRCRQAR